MHILNKTTLSILAMSLSLSLFSLTSQAQQSTSAATSTPKIGSDSILELNQLALKAIEQGQFSTAADHYTRLASIDTQNLNFPYNAACAFSMAGQLDLAFVWLDKAIKAGYMNLEHLKKDTDLIPLYKDARWSALLENLSVKIKKDAKLWDSDVWKTPYNSNLSEDQRMAGLAKLWSEVKYGFVFTDTLKELDWDAQFISYIPKIKAATTTEQYYRLLMSFAALLKDGHTQVIPPRELNNQIFARPLMRANLIEDRVILTELFDESLRVQGLSTGVEVVKVDGEPVKHYLQKHSAPVISASTSQDMERRLYNSLFLMGPIDQKLELTVQDHQGKLAKYQVSRFDSKERSKMIPALPAFSWRMLDNNIAYVALNSFANETAARDYLAAFPQISKAKGIIFDLRKNGGGNGSVGYKILSTLVSQAFEVGASSTRDYKPAMRAWGKSEPAFAFEPRKIPADPLSRYAGKVMVLSSAQTYSAAEDFLVAFDLMQRGTIIGEASGGSTGQPLVVNLPGGGMATIVSKHDTYPDGKAFVGVGVQVKRKVIPTIKDFRANKDTVLEAALLELN
jgi:carboxyl-terminal processing protease